MLGGCVARTASGQTVTPPLIQIQTRITPLISNTTAFIGYECEEPNPSGDAEWNRLCPCLVNISTDTISEEPSPSPSAAPSVLAALNTIYIRGAYNCCYYIAHIYH